MKLLLRRNQKSGMLSKGITFTLDVRAELTAAEAENVKKFRMGDTVLCKRIEPHIHVRVDGLEKGYRVECKDILEMLAVEEQIKEECKKFGVVLQAAAQFGGEEIIEI